MQMAIVIVGKTYWNPFLGFFGDLVVSVETGPNHTSTMNLILCSKGSSLIMIMTENPIKFISSVSENDYGRSGCLMSVLREVSSIASVKIVFCWDAVIVQFMN